MWAIYLRRPWLAEVVSQQQQLAPRLICWTRTRNITPASPAVSDLGGKSRRRKPTREGLRGEWSLLNALARSGPRQSNGPSCWANDENRFLRFWRYHSVIALNSCRFKGCWGGFGVREGGWGWFSGKLNKLMGGFSLSGGFQFRREGVSSWRQTIGYNNLCWNNYTRILKRFIYIKGRMIHVIKLFRWQSMLF